MQNNSKKILDFSEVYHCNKKPLYNYVRKMVNERTVIEDILQNIFLKLYENLENIKNLNSINYWLFKTARNEIYGFWRKNRKNFEPEKSNYEEVISDYDVNYEIEKKDLINMIDIELDKQDQSHKEIFILREYSGLSYREIAKVLNISEDLVKSRLFKLRQKLIKKFSKYI